jgi:hypothetical protein
MPSLANLLVQIQQNGIPTKWIIFVVLCAHLIEHSPNIKLYDTTFDNIHVKNEGCFLHMCAIFLATYWNLLSKYDNFRIFLP